MSKNPYKVLGLDPKASKDDIRKAYRKLAHKYHPDVNPGDKKAENRFKEISAANDILSDAKKRKNYDEFGEDSLKNGFDSARARQYKQWQQQGQRSPFGGSPGAGFGGAGFDLGDILSGFGGMGRQPGGFGQRQGPRKGPDFTTKVTVGFKDSVTGSSVALSLSNGKKLTIKIPSGIEHDSTMRLKGQGQPGHHGGPPGDLMVHVSVKHHPFLTRDGLNLILPVPVTLEEAYTGATITIPTFEGSVKLTIPPGTQPGSKLRLKSKGIKKGNNKGDLLVEIKVKLPPKGNEKFTLLAKELCAEDSKTIRDHLGSL